MQLILSKRNVSLIVFAILGMIAFTFFVNYSKDWNNYLWLNNKIGKKDWVVHFSQFSFFTEPIFTFFTKFFAQLLGFQTFIFLVSVSLLTIKLRYLEKIVGVFLGGMFFYLCLYLFLFEGTAIRVAFATALVVPAFYCLKQNKPLIALFLLLLGSQIHFTVLIFLIVFPIYYWSGATLIAYILFAIAPFFILLDISVFGLMSEIIEYLNPRYLRYGDKKLINQNSTGLYFYFIAFFTIVISISHYYLKDLISKDRFIRTMQILCVLAVVVMCIFHDHVALGARLGELLMLPLVIILSLLSIRFNQDKMHLERYTLYSVFSLYFLARFHYLYPEFIHAFR